MSSTQATTPTRDRFRPELQGLRAFAVMMVVVYHIWFGRVSGGVDIFLMISAFLLTLSFLRKSEQGRPFRLASHWLHRFKRLVPAALATIMATLGVAWVVYPRPDYGDLVDQGWASLLYYQNWQLISVSTDYFGADAALQSPLQHFWSLSIQGQVFIIWPILFVVARFLAKRFHVTYTLMYGLLFGAIFAASLAWSIYFTRVDQPVAYFQTWTRLWEFAFGSLLAVSVTFFDRLSTRMRVALGWAGLASMLAVGLTVDVSREFPGWIGLWPMISAGAVMVAGLSGSRFGADRLLTSPLLISLGNVSYSLYLAHWAILTLYRARVDRQDLSIVEGAGIIFMSLIAAYLLHWIVETPLRRLTWTDKNNLNRLVILVVALAVGIASMTSAQRAFGGYQAGIEAEKQARLEEISASIREFGSIPDPQHPGAAVFAEGYSGPTADFAEPVLPEPAQAARDWASRGDACTQEAGFDTSDIVLESCRRSLVTDNPTRTIYIIGDSHSAQLLSVLVPIGYAVGWDITLFQLADLESLEASSRTDDPDFVEWTTDVMDLAIRNQPDVVLTVGTETLEDGKGEILNPGFQQVVDQLNNAGIEVVAFRDNPRFNQNVLNCTVEANNDPDACGIRFEDTYAAENPLNAVQSDSFGSIDLTEYYCPDGWCPTIAGNVMMYVDTNHVTATYGQTMAPLAFVKMRDALDWPELK